MKLRNIASTILEQVQGDFAVSGWFEVEGLWWTDRKGGEWGTEPQSPTDDWKIITFPTKQEAERFGRAVVKVPATYNTSKGVAGSDGKALGQWKGKVQVRPTGFADGAPDQIDVHQISDIYGAHRVDKLSRPANASDYAAVNLTPPSTSN